MTYHINHIATIVQGQFSGPAPDEMIDQLLIDSRRLLFPRSSLFFALIGDRRDGHTYVADLYARGVRNFVVSKKQERDQFPEANFIQVNNTLEALQLLSVHHRRQFSIPVIGITGSNGKTIVKEWLNQLLEDEYDIVRSPKSYNSQVGVPLSVWQMNDHHQLAIFEAGISQAGEMEKLQRIIQPDIGIFTNIGEAHSEGFLNSGQKIKEKLRLFSNVKLLVYCKDYPDIQENVALLWQRLNKGTGDQLELFSWSAVTDAKLQLLNIYKEQNTSTITASFEGETIEISIPFTDEASIENAMHCWSILLYLKIPREQIRKKMLKLGQVAMRLELKPGINHCTVINDSYSADLSSLRIALDFLAQQSPQQPRTVILSDILQSGRQEKKLYSEIAEYLKQRQVKRLIAIGERIGQHKALFLQVPGLESLFYLTVEQFIKDFDQLVFRDEVILLKGARIFEFERIGSMLEQKVHQTILEIDLGALQHNLKQYQQQLRPETRLMAMVKAFAYGSGGFQVARILQFHKIEYLAVAYADEGVELRKAGISLPIMVMNPDASTFMALVQYNLEPELYSLAQASAFTAFLKREGIQQYPVHIELETGMNRLGFAAADLPGLIDLLGSRHLKVQSIFSHLVASEDPQHDAFTGSQAALFGDMSQQLLAALPYPALKHIANSSGIARHPALQYDMVRLGIGLYGVGGENENLDLQEVSTLRSVIAQIKHLPAGETVGYGRAGMLLRDSKIATVGIGYADGYSRALSNGNGKMWVNGHLAPVVGNICMDMTMIDITDIPGVKEGDSVVIFGKELSVKQVARWAQTIPYEMLTGISQRVKRVYFEE